MSFPIFEKYENEFNKIYPKPDTNMIITNELKKQIESDLNNYTWDWFEKTIPKLYNTEYPCVHLVKLINHCDTLYNYSFNNFKKYLLNCNYQTFCASKKKIIKNNTKQFDSYYKQFLWSDRELVDNNNNYNNYIKNKNIENFLKNLPLINKECPKLKILKQKPFYFTIATYDKNRIDYKGNIRPGLLKNIFPLKDGKYCNTNCINCKLRKLKNNLQEENFKCILKLQEEINELKKIIKINKENNKNEFKKLKEFNKNTFKLNKKIISDLQKLKSNKF